MSLTTWTTDQMLSLAPDAILARAAERLANPNSWLVLGSAPDVIWGEVAVPNKTSYHVFATLPELALYCDCPARKRPCRHAVSLALLAAREQASFVEQEPPDWVRDRLGAWPAPDFGQRQSADQQADAVSTYEAQLRAVKRGMSQCERWLKDIVHGGLAGLPGLPISQWNEMAARMSQAQALQIAQDIRDTRKAADGRAGWPQATLPRLGRLYLLAQGFAAYDTLPAEAQADLRGAAGWFDDPTSPGQELVRDRWLVLGTAHLLQGHGNIHRTWLYGLEHQRYAFISRRSGKESVTPALFAGTSLDANLRFAPGGWPQRAAIETLFSMSQQGGSIRGTGSLQAARTDYGKALSVNPWIRQFPLALRDLQVELEGGQWVLRDEEGHLMPLPQLFFYGWHLQVMSTSTESLLFGEWDGSRFMPLTVYHDGTWLSLRVLRGQK